METHVSSEENEDPGAAPYGNFINYYSFNPPENRLGLIPEALLENIGFGSDRSERVLMLDVGCNSGVRMIYIVFKSYFCSILLDVKLVK